MSHRKNAALEMAQTHNLRREDQMTNYTDAMIQLTWQHIDNKEANIVTA
jgi:hypothetical protein